MQQGGRTGQRNSVHKGRARQGRRRAKRVVEHAGRRPSVKSGTRDCLRRRKAPVGKSGQTPLSRSGSRALPAKAMQAVLDRVATARRSLRILEERLRQEATSYEALGV